MIAFSLGPVIVQSLSCVRLLATPWTATCQTFLSFTFWSLLKLMSIKLVMPSNHLILAAPSPPAFYLSQHQGLFQWVSSLHQVAKYWSFSLSISLSSEYSGLISFRLDWYDLPAIQGTLKSFLQDHNLKASILWCLAFFMVQLSHPHGTTGKIIVLTTCIFFRFV